MKKFDLSIEKRQFVNNRGENVDYFEFSFDLNGNKIRVKPVDEDKKLANYLLKEIVKGGEKA